MSLCRNPEDLNPQQNRHKDLNCQTVNHNTQKRHVTCILVTENIQSVIVPAVLESSINFRLSRPKITYTYEESYIHFEEVQNIQHITLEIVGMT